MATTTPKVVRNRAIAEVEPVTPSESKTEATGSFDGPAYTPARALLAHFGRWQGDDLEELLEEVYRTRSKVSW